MYIIYIYNTYLRTRYINVSDIGCQSPPPRCPGIDTVAQHSFPHAYIVRVRPTVTAAIERTPEMAAVKGGKRPFYPQKACLFGHVPYEWSLMGTDFREQYWSFSPTGP